MKKPTVIDYIQAIKETQSSVISCLALTNIFLICGMALAIPSDQINIFFWLSTATGILGILLYMQQYQPVERIKTRAVVIASRRQGMSLASGKA